MAGQLNVSSVCTVARYTSTEREVHGARKTDGIETATWCIRDLKKERYMTRKRHEWT